MAPPVFKTGGRRFAPPAGSIPVRLRHLRKPHPALWTSSGPEARAAAARICLTRCPVLTQCLDWSVTALPATDPAVWAGTGPRERTALRRAQRAAQAALDAVLHPAA